MIVNLFPAEEEARDYYFINRKGKRNPMGRLYTKYYNTLKRIRVRDIHQEFTNESMCSFLQTGSLKDDTSKTKKASTAVLTNEATTSASANQTNSINTTDDNKNSNNNSNTQIEFIADDFEELLESNDTSSSTAKDVLRCQGLNWDNVKTLWSQTHLIRQEDIEHSTVKDVIQQWPKYLNARGMELVCLYGCKSIFSM